MYFVHLEQNAGRNAFRVAQAPVSQNFGRIIQAGQWHFTSMSAYHFLALQRVSGQLWPVHQRFQVCHSHFLDLSGPPTSLQIMGRSKKFGLNRDICGTYPSVFKRGNGHSENSRFLSLGKSSNQIGGWGFSRKP